MTWISLCDSLSDMTGAELYELRKAAGVSQKYMAARLGVDVMTVSRWERGIHGIRKRDEIAIKYVLRQRGALVTLPGENETDGTK